MTDQDAMKLALEALENSIDLVEEDYANAVNLYGKYPSRAQRLIGMETMRDDHLKAITALREALAAQPAMPFVPDAIHHTDTSEPLMYIQGWNDCRQAMLAEQPAQRDTRNKTLDEIATKIQAMPFGDTAASFAVWIRAQKT